MVNLLGSGPRRPARLIGVDAALEDPAVHLHLYGKREVFERRKMGHVTALGETVDEALARAYAAVGRIAWEGVVPAGVPVDPPHAAVTGWRPMTEPTQPVVGVVGGSRSDFPILEAAVKVLGELDVPAELRVVSAHRTPDRLFAYAETAAGRGIRVIIAGAGGAAHLPGMLAAKTLIPVIGVPIPTEHLGGLDSLLSIVQMPRGIPVATVAIGNAQNAGLLAAAILALSDDALAGRLASWRERLTQAVLDDPSNRAP
jgi:5-(carboxyamino)imidazole ribonucleotide mutase